MTPTHIQADSHHLQWYHLQKLSAKVIILANHHELDSYLSSSRQHTPVPTLIYTQFTHATISMENVGKQKASMRPCPQLDTSDHVDKDIGQKYV